MANEYCAPVIKPDEPLEPVFLDGRYWAMGHQDDLVRANEHIADAERRIEKQRALIAVWTSKNRDITEARLMLENMLNLLEQMRWHRTQIEAELSGRYMIPLKRVNGASQQDRARSDGTNRETQE